MFFDIQTLSVPLKFLKLRVLYRVLQTHYDHGNTASAYLQIILSMILLIFNCIKNQLFISCLSKVEQGILAIKGIRKKKVSRRN
jgi:hypothetical protein